MSDDGLLNDPGTDAPEPAENSLDSPGKTYRSVVADDGAFSENWHDLLTKDEKYADAAKTVSRYKTLPELAKGYAELRRELSRRGSEVGVPGKDATAEQVSKYREALGIPTTAEDYKLERPEGVPEDLWDPAAAKTYSEVFHKNNIPPGAAKELIETYMQVEQARADAIEAHRAGELERARKELQAEFGAEMTRQLDLARRLAITAGVDPNDPAFNSPAVVKALAFAGRNMGEDRMVSSETSGGLQSGAARARDIAQNPQNPLHAKYQAGDPDAVAMVTRLLKSQI